MSRPEPVLALENPSFIIAYRVTGKSLNAFQRIQLIHRLSINAGSGCISRLPDALPSLSCVIAKRAARKTELGFKVSSCDTAHIFCRLWQILKSDESHVRPAGQTPGRHHRGIG